MTNKSRINHRANFGFPNFNQRENTLLFVDLEWEHGCNLFLQLVDNSWRVELGMSVTETLELQGISSVDEILGESKVLREGSPFFSGNSGSNKRSESVSSTK